MKTKIIGDALPNIPWENKPAGYTDIMWRWSGNPVLGSNPMPGIQGIYNSAVVPFEGAFLGVFRTESYTRFPFLHLGRSRDGLHWEIERERIKFTSDDPTMSGTDYAYDPRVCKIDDTYYITWCGGHNGPTISIAATKDFKQFHRIDNAFLPFNRNGVLFPRKINGNFYMFSRPSDNGHTPFGDIYLSQSPDMTYWGKHRMIMPSGGDEYAQWWQRTKVGAGPIPIETAEGWLMIYHGVIDTCSGFVYSAGAAILDLDDPSKVLYRTNQHILTPVMPYETIGHVANVVFPCAALCDAATGRLAVYYGSADTCTCLAFTTVDDLMDFTKANSQVF